MMPITIISRMLCLMVNRKSRLSSARAIPVAATEAADEDFDVIVVSDAVAGAPQEHVESMMKYTLPFIATLTTVDELLSGGFLVGLRRQWVRRHRHRGSWSKSS